MRIRITTNLSEKNQELHDMPLGKADSTTAPSEEISLSPFEGIHREMERLLEEASRWHRPAHCSWERLWQPRCNVYECSDHISVLVDLAGVKKEALDIRADVRTLYIRGERETPIPETAERCHHMEIPSGLFERQLNLPTPIDPERVTVILQDGWLEIDLPKAEKMRVEIEE